MVIFLRREAKLPEPGGRGGARTIPDHNIRALFVFPYRMWSKLPPLQTSAPLQHPVKHVIASWTNTQECWSEWECVTEMWKIQKSYRERGMEIPYNFIVGGDSNIYECRGWNAQPEKCERYPDLEGASLEIAHIGWKCEDERDPYTGMCHQAWLLLESGIAKGHLDKDLDFKPDYDPLFGTPWGKLGPEEYERSREDEEEEIREYMKEAKDEFLDDTVDAKFV